MSEPTPAETLSRKVSAYHQEQAVFWEFSRALESVLRRACLEELPDAIVQARAKSLTSFAGKCIRRPDSYSDPLQEMTDLCGARVIVQTTTQVLSVRQYIEDNFEVVETEDIGLRLGDREFGYRDRHYIVRLNPLRAREIGFTSKQIRSIGRRVAELQVRTWAQHAWADTLHDRTYKPVLAPGKDAERRAAILAALMETGDKLFDGVANEIDSLTANYAAEKSRTELIGELAVQTSLLQHASEQDQTGISVELARIHLSLGNHDAAIALLDPRNDDIVSGHEYLKLELGTAICLKHRGDPASPEYRRGLRVLTDLNKHLNRPADVKVRNLGRLKALKARCASKLGWALEADDKTTADAQKHHHHAYQLESSNPYYLANLIGFELSGPHSALELPQSLRPILANAVLLCRDHQERRLQLPDAFFAAGRLSLLLGDEYGALDNYILGAHYCLDKRACAGANVLEDETRWIFRIWRGRTLPTAFDRARQLMELILAANMAAEAREKLHQTIPPNILLIASDGSQLDSKQKIRLRTLLEPAFAAFRGKVAFISSNGGFNVLVGEMISKLRRKGRMDLEFYPNNPRSRPPTPNPKDGSSEVTPDTILAMWSDLLRSGASPKSIQVLALGTDPLAGFQLQLALALGAEVGVLQDPVAQPNTPPPPRHQAYARFSTFLTLPWDRATLRAFLGRPMEVPGAESIEAMAESLHLRYLSQSSGRMPENLRPWRDLPTTYREANREQARYAMEIVKAIGFFIRKATGPEDAMTLPDLDLYRSKVEELAELEHGRWNIDRLRAGWRPGPRRDDKRRIQPFIVEWTNKKVLTKSIKDYDRNSVLAFPELLRLAGLILCSQPAPQSGEIPTPAPPQSAP